MNLAREATYILENENPGNWKKANNNNYFYDSLFFAHSFDLGGDFFYHTNI